VTESKWGYEGKDQGIDRELHGKFLVGFLATIVVVCLVAGAVILGFFDFLKQDMNRADSRPSALVEQSGRQLPPLPRLQANPRADLRTMRAGEDSILESYGWELKSAEVARVPIEEAMKMVVREGIPVWPQPSDSTVGGTPQSGAPGGAQ
jgi:hypothetical protein